MIWLIWRKIDVRRKMESQGVCCNFEGSAREGGKVPTKLTFTEGEDIFKWVVEKGLRFVNLNYKGEAWAGDSSHKYVWRNLEYALFLRISYLFTEDTGTLDQQYKIFSLFWSSFSASLCSRSSSNLAKGFDHRPFRHIGVSVPSGIPCSVVLWLEVSSTLCSLRNTVLCSGPPQMTGTFFFFF